MGLLLQIRMSWLRALSKGRRCWRWCCDPGRWRCELAERADGRRRWSSAGAAAGVVSCKAHMHTLESGLIGATAQGSLGEKVA